MKVVYGGAGFIGSNLCDELIRRGEQVTCIDDLSGGRFENIAHLTKNSNFLFVAKDLFTAHDFTGVDTVFNLACVKNKVSDRDPVVCAKVNAMGALHLVTEAVKQGVQYFVHSSTGSVYGNADHIDINTPLRPLNVYGISKTAGDSYVRFFADRINITVLRYFHVYGRRQWNGQMAGVVGMFLQAMKTDRRITVYGDGRQYRSFTTVDDCVKANLCNLQGIYNVCSGVRVSINELISIIEEVAGQKFIIDYQPERPKDVKDFHVKTVLPIEWQTNVNEVIHDLWKSGL